MNLLGVQNKQHVALA